MYSLFNSKHLCVSASKYASALLLSFAATALLSGPIHAAGPGIPLEVFLASVEGRWVLTQAPGANELLTRLAGEGASEQLTREELINLARVRLLQPELVAERSATEQRFAQIHERFAKAARGKEPRAADAELTHEEKVLLNLAAEELKINPEWQAGGKEGKTIEFFSSTPAENFAAHREQFLRQTPDPAFSDNGSSTPVAERPAARARIKQYISEMKDCVSARPPTANSHINYKFLLSQLVIDETMTAGGAVVAAGGLNDVDWKTLPNDLIFGAFASVGNSLISAIPNTPGARVDVRWWRMQGFGVAQSAADAVIYQITPSKHKHTVSTGARLAYNTAWNAGYARLYMGLYDLIAGLECMDVSGAVVVGTQVGFGLGTNVAYFALRNQVLGKNPQ